MKENKLLEGLFSLDHNIRLYIPSTINVDKHINNKQYVEQALSLFSEWFGGATTYNAIGAWKTNSKLIEEKVVIVESYATAKQVEDSLSKVLELARDLKATLAQEAISLEYDNKLYFI